MICKGNFLDTYFKSLQKKLTWCQTFLREKRKNGISAEALTCSQPQRVMLLLPPCRAQVSGQPLPFTALLSPRTTWLLLPSSQAAKHPLSAASSHSCLPLGQGPAVTRVDHPQVSNSKCSGSLHLPNQCYSLARSGLGLVMGQIPVGQLYILGDACRGCTQCWTLQAGFPPTGDLWDMLILPSPEIPCLKCLWALTAEGMHKGTF